MEKKPPNTIVVTKKKLVRKPVQPAAPTNPATAEGPKPRRPTLSLSKKS